MKKTPDRPPHGRVTHADYTCPRWITGGHVQTLWPVLQRRAHVKFRRERVTTPDQDFWDFDWLDAPADDNAPLVVLFHGLEGSSHSHYARSMMATVARRRWRGVVPHFRGCGGEINQQPRVYHMGDHLDIDAMLAAIRSRVPDGTPLYAVGVSLGGSALINWLGRVEERGQDILNAAAAISTPIDLEATGVALDTGLNHHIYERHFMSTLKPKAFSMARLHPDKIDPKKVTEARTLRDFENLITAPLSGFKDSPDYRHKASARPWLRKIGVRTLVLNALNDPMVPANTLPSEEEASPYVQLERTEEGGHAGFPSINGPEHAWMPQRVLRFFEHGH